MSDCDPNELVLRLWGWIQTVAYNFSNMIFLSREDFAQEAAVAILEAEPVDEALAKTIAIRAMIKLRDRHGLSRVTRRVDGVPKKMTRHSNDRVMVLSTDPKKNGECSDVSGGTIREWHKALTTAPTDGGIFWDNMADDLTEVQLQTLKKWVESDYSTEEIGRQEGTSGSTVKYRLKGAIEKVRERWGVECDEPIPKRKTTEVPLDV